MKVQLPIFIKRLLGIKPKNLSILANNQTRFTCIGLIHREEFVTIYSRNKFREMYQKYHYPINSNSYSLYEPLYKNLKKDLISKQTNDKLLLRNKTWRFYE